MKSNMDKFKEVVKSQGGIWESDDVYFSQTRDKYWAQYMPHYPINRKGDTVIAWDDIRRKVSIYVRNSDSPFFRLLQKMYEKSPSEYFYNKDITYYVSNPDLLESCLNAEVEKDTITEENRDFDI